MLQFAAAKRVANSAELSPRPMKVSRLVSQDIILIDDSQPEVVEVLDCDQDSPGISSSLRVVNPGKGGCGAIFSSEDWKASTDSSICVQTAKGQAICEPLVTSPVLESKPQTEERDKPVKRTKKAANIQRPAKTHVGGYVTLAKNWDTGIDVSGWMMSEKLDGMRAVWVKGALYTRTGNLIQAPPFFLEKIPPDVVLDGELFLGRGKFHEVMSVCRSSKMDDRWKNVKYMVFDAPEANGGISERLKVAREALDIPRGEPEGAWCVQVLDQDVCKGPEMVMERLAEIEGAGGEGVMLRHPTATYKAGRVRDLLKVKSFKDDEALVVGHQGGVGKHGGRLGALECRSRTGKSFKVGTGFSDMQREAPPPIGSVITFKYFELSKTGIPRFPVYGRIRPDIEVADFH